MNVDPSKITLGAMLLVLILLAFAVFGMSGGQKGYDEFAQCLTQKGFKMYGSVHCGHCNEQKTMFGDSWQYIDYVECSLPNGPGQAEECRQAGIRAYPTWVLPDGTEVLGKQSFETLSGLSGCPLP